MIETGVTPVRMMVLGSVGVLHAVAGGYYRHAHLEAAPRTRLVFCEMVNMVKKEQHAVQQLNGAVQA